MRWLALLLGLIRIAGSDTGGGRGAGDRETESVVSVHGFWDSRKLYFYLVLVTGGSGPG